MNYLDLGFLVGFSLVECHRILQEHQCSIDEPTSCIWPIPSLYPASFLGIVMGLKVTGNTFQANTQYIIWIPILSYFFPRLSYSSHFLSVFLQSWVQVVVIFHFLAVDLHGGAHKCFFPMVVSKRWLCRRNVHLQVTAEKTKQVVRCTWQLVVILVADHTAIFSCNVKNVTGEVKFSEIQQNHRLHP